MTPMTTWGMGPQGKPEFKLPGTPTPGQGRTHELRCRQSGPSVLGSPTRSQHRGRAHRGVQRRHPHRQQPLQGQGRQHSPAQSRLRHGDHKDGPSLLWLCGVGAECGVALGNCD